MSPCFNEQGDDSCQGHAANPYQQTHLSFEASNTTHHVGPVIIQELLHSTPQMVVHRFKSLLASRFPFPYRNGVLPHVGIRSRHDYPAGRRFSTYVALVCRICPSRYLPTLDSSLDRIRDNNVLALAADNRVSLVQEHIHSFGYE